MQITLPEPIEKRFLDQVRAGKFASAEQLVSTAVLSLLDREQRSAARVAALDALAAKVHNAGLYDKMILDEK